MRSNAIRVNAKDSVAVVAHPVKKGGPVVVDGQHLLDAAEDILLGHKVALAPLSPGEKVFRYGEPIVEATQDIGVGAWVHVHNTRPIPADA